MPYTTLSSKGQMVIPKSIRDRMRLRPGDRLEVLLRDDRIVIRKPAGSLDDLSGSLSHLARGPVSVEEMNRAIEHGALYGEDPDDGP